MAPSRTIGAGSDVSDDFRGYRYSRARLAGVVKSSSERKGRADWRAKPSPPVPRRPRTTPHQGVVALGFVTKHRRVKEIETPYGRKLVQDNNAYEIHMPLAGSPGDRILRGDLSESKIERAKARPYFSEDSSLPEAPKPATDRPNFAPKPIDSPIEPIAEAERSIVRARLHALLARFGPQPAT
jgi:hypothetical protein